MSKTICGGGKGGGSAYDPQIGVAAANTSRTAKEALDWSKQYYAETVAPLLKQQTEAAVKAQGQMGDLYGLQAEQMRTASERFTKYGAPAEEAYYNKVRQYNEPAEFERQSAAALGDLRMAQQGQQQQQLRQMGALGIDPTSPAYMSAMSDRSVQNAAMEAGALNRSRAAAKDLGMRLTADAANFGRGGLSNVTALGQGALGASSGAMGAATGALQGGISAGQGVQQGYGQALSGYGQVMNTYGGLGQTDIQAQAQTAGGMWGALGSMAGIGAGIAIKSDIRLKENITKVGQLPSGINIYKFDYIDGDKNQIGVMAQEVLPVIPDAVIVGDDGFFMVDYSKLH